MTSNNTSNSFLEPTPRKLFTDPPRVVIIGAGSRGTAYAQGVLASTNSTISAVVEPIPSNRVRFGRRFIWSEDESLSSSSRLVKKLPEHEFEDWRDWVAYETTRRKRERAGEKVEAGANVVFVCVLDEMHEEVVCGVAGLGVHVCCEKPLATRLEGCLNIWRALKSAGGGGGEERGANGTETKKKKESVFGICHVLRYSPHNMLLRHLVLQQGVIGEVMSVEHVEPVGWWHFSHSYVRGNWRKESKTAPSLLTKSCHDIDFLMWMLCTPPSHTSSEPHLPSRITSTGTRNFFRRARKPKAAGDATNCLSCHHEPDCLYSAKKIYMDRHLDRGVTSWPVKIVNPEIEDIYKTQGKEAAKSQLLRDLGEDYTGQTPMQEIEGRPWFGRCVWEADNDVCDDQSVTLTWDDDVSQMQDEDQSAVPAGRGAKTAQFHMVAFTEAQCERRGRIYGTKGEMEYDSTVITVYDFASKSRQVYKPHLAGGGHGGGDEGLVRQFLMAVDAVETGELSAPEAQRRHLGCDLDEALRSHAVVFAAEEARSKNEVVEWAPWWEDRVENPLRSTQRQERLRSGEKDMMGA